ncbi:MAG: protein kinase [Thermoanaerobaculia bacterium]|nr:protein kinase [Thermoanaerobaculia bacterium]
MEAPLEQIVGGKYEILGKIREGGMGSIYKVRHRLLEQMRVIKVLHPQLAHDDKVRLRFQNEAKVAIRLRHPNIAQLFDFSVDDSGVAYIVMEYIDGVNLHELVEASGPPSLGLAVEIGGQSLRALRYLHREGFVHRDIAPDNLMLSKDFRGEPLVKLIDLGIAKGADTSGLTATGMFMGKGRYAAPEQFSKGAADLDERSDIYSFGVLFYELLTGRSPVSGEDFSEIVAGHLFQPPLDFEISDPEGRIPPGLRALVLQALEKEPGRRVASAAEFFDRLTEFRDAAPSRSAELADAMKTTTSVKISDLRASKPGSTQERLDRHFRLGEESKGGEEEVPELKVVQPARTPPPQATRPEGPPAAAADEAAGPPATGRRRSTALMWAGVGTLLVVALAVSAWLLWPGSTPPTSPAGPPVEVSRVDPFSPREAPSGPTVDTEAAEVPPPESGDDAPPPPDARPRPPRPEGGEGSAEGPQPAADAPPPDAPPAVADPLLPPGPQVAPSEQAGQMYAPGPGVVPPRPIQVPDPVLPADTREPKDVFEVVVSVLVNEEGRPLTSKIARAPLFRRRFREAATEAAMGATFQPPTKAGVPGKMWFDLTFRFGGG